MLVNLASSLKGIGVFRSGLKADLDDVWAVLGGGGGGEKGSLAEWLACTPSSVSWRSRYIMAALGGDTNEHLRNSSRSPRKEVFECASHAAASAAAAIANAVFHGCESRMEIARLID